MVLLRGVLMLMLLIVSKTMGLFEDALEMNTSFVSNNCSTIDSVVSCPLFNDEQRDRAEIKADGLINRTRNNTNISHLKTFTVPKDWNEQNSKLKFPKISSDEQYKIPNLHLDKGIFIFDFLRKFLSFIQPYDIPVDLLVAVTEKRIKVSKLISESIHVEAVLLGMIGLCCILCCIVPATGLWFACSPIREDYKPTRHPGVLAFLLTFFVCILGICMITMIVCNETVSTSVAKFPITAKAALQDLNDYHSGTTLQFRKCLSRSLDVASEAILADLDHVEELLGKPVQMELSTETKLDVALDALIDLANDTYEVSSKVQLLLNDGEKARNLGKLLKLEIDDMRRNIESALNACTGSDRPLCSIISHSGLRLTLQMDQLAKDTHLLLLRSPSRGNLAEMVRQAQGEYLYIPQHVARYTLNVRNQIRREVNRMRARIFDEGRKMETSNIELMKQLEFARNLVDYVTSYIVDIEYIRWSIGIGTVMCILPIWLLLFGAVCCRGSSCEDNIRPTILCGVSMTCIVSIALWIVFIMYLTLSSHTEMLICRPLEDPNYHMVEAILETRQFLGQKLSVPLKELLGKCRENETAYPVFGLGNTLKLEQLTAYWTWSSFSKIMSQLKIDLKSLRIFTPYLQQRLQDLLHACGLNLTEHRIMIQGPILNKDLIALSDQVDKVAREMNDRILARSLESIAINLQDLTLTRVKPLLKLQDELLYKLAGLELQVQSLQRQVNQSLSHMKTIQYYIDNQGNNMAQLKTKMYEDRLGNYLDQWRSHVLSEMGSGVAKCRPVWDALQGINILLCSHFLGNLSGYWFATFLCAIVMIAVIPVAYILSLVYKKPPASLKDTTLMHIRSENSQSTVNEQETWNTPEPPPPPPEEG